MSEESTEAPLGKSREGAPLDALEAIATARTIRRYRFDPIPDEHLRQILWAATRAPSGTNRQPFRLLVLRNGPRARQAKRVLGDAFRRGWAEKSSAEGWGGGSAASRKARSARAMQHFVDNFERIPVVILACFRRYRDPHHMEGASVFPACQNLLLAARTLGYGACFSGWHLRVEQQLRELLEIPDDVIVSMTITLGKPLGKHGPLRRLPAPLLVYDDRWENPAEWVRDPPGTRFTRPRGRDAQLLGLDPEQDESVS